MTLIKNLNVRDNFYFKKLCIFKNIVVGGDLNPGPVHDQDPVLLGEVYGAQNPSLVFKIRLTFQDSRILICDSVIRFTESFIRSPCCRNEM